MANDTIRVRFTADAGQLKNVLASTSKAVDSFASKAGASFSAVSKNLLGLAGLPATKGEIFVAAGRKLLEFGVAAVKAGAQTEAAFKGVEAVFGRSSSTIESFGKLAADKFGLSEKSLYALTTPIGALVKGLGFSEAEAAKASLQFAKLGADLSAAFPTQGGPDQAVQALGAALRGEYDPAERFGIGLSETTVKAKMLAMGMNTATGSVDLYGRAQAVLALITERTASVQGQFARNSDTVNGRMQILRARAENLAVSFGKELTPSAEVFLETAEELLPVVAEIGSAFADLVNWFAKTSKSFGDWTKKYYDFIDKVKQEDYKPKSFAESVVQAVVDVAGVVGGGEGRTMGEYKLGLSKVKNFMKSDAGRAPAHVQALSYLGNIRQYGKIHGDIGSVFGAGPYSAEALHQHHMNLLTTNIPQLQAELGAAGADVAYIALEGAAAFSELLTASGEVGQSFRVNAAEAKNLREKLSALKDMALSYVDVAIAYAESDERIADAQDKLITKQEEYNEAVNQFGADSREARAAARDLTYAQNDITRSVDDAAKAYANQQRLLAEKEGKIFGDDAYLRAYSDELKRLADVANSGAMGAGMQKVIEDLQKAAYEAAMLEKNAKLAAEGLWKSRQSWVW